MLLNKTNCRCSRKIITKKKEISPRVMKSFLSSTSCRHVRRLRRHYTRTPWLRKRRENEKKRNKRWLFRCILFARFHDENKWIMMMIMTIQSKLKWETAGTIYSRACMWVTCCLCEGGLTEWWDPRCCAATAAAAWSDCWETLVGRSRISCTFRTW